MLQARQLQQQNPITTNMSMIDPEPTILSPHVFFISDTDSFTESSTPLSSRMRTGTTKKVTRLQTPPTIAVAIRPRIPARLSMRCRMIPTVAEMSAHARMAGRCREALAIPSPTDISLPFRWAFTQTYQCRIKENNHKVTRCIKCKQDHNKETRPGELPGP